MKLKDLKWKNIADKRWEANTVFGTYWIRRWPEGYDVYITFDCHQIRYYDTLDEAKKAAQEDLRKRILSCIDHEADK